MIHRYKLIRGQPGFSVRTTHLLIILVWTVSAVQSVLWYFLAPGKPLYHLESSVVRVALLNLLVLTFAIPFPVVLILVLLIAVKARQHISRISEYDLEVAQQMQGGLGLLYAFAAVFIFGYGLSFTASVNSMINLCGYVNVVPNWGADERICRYFFGFDAILDLLINIANSVIVARSRHVNVTLKKMYRATSNAVRSIGGGRSKDSQPQSSQDEQ